jgi:hypothetical protein
MLWSIDRRSCRRRCRDHSFSRGPGDRDARRACDRCKFSNQLHGIEVGDRIDDLVSPLADHERCSFRLLLGQEASRRNSTFIYVFTVDFNPQSSQPRGDISSSPLAVVGEKKVNPWQRLRQTESDHGSDGRPRRAAARLGRPPRLAHTARRPK